MRIPHPALWIALAIGLFVRLSLVLRDAFPLNDGGMFYAMAQDIQRNHFNLPSTTSYNGGLPFAYPPLGLYMAAFVELVTPFDLVQVFAFLPLVFNVLTIVAAYFLFRAVLRSNAAAGFSIIAFVLLPRSFTWLIVGGGVTRSPGFLFAILGLLFVLLFFTKQRWRYFWPSAAFCALTVLTHPEVGWFLAFSCGLLFIRYGLHRNGVLGAAAVAIATVVLAAPWWGTVVARDGLEPLLAAGSTGDHGRWWPTVAGLPYLYFTEEPQVKVLGLLGFAGLLVAVARGYILIAVWFIVIFIAEPRSANTYATLPFAMFIGVLVAEVFVARSRGGREDRPLLGWDRLGRVGQALPTVAAASLLLLAGGYALVKAREANVQVLQTVSAGDRTAMDWVEANTPPDSTFLIIEQGAWADAQTSEWFPALTNRKSVATVQGLEWASSEAFEAGKYGFQQVSQCSFRDLACLQVWELFLGQPYDYVYLSKWCCGADLIGGLNKGEAYELVYVSKYVGIWRHKPTLDHPSVEWTKHVIDYLVGQGVPVRSR